MIYIPKTNKDAIEFVSDFIKNNWLEQIDNSYRYQNIGFSDIKNPAEIFRGFFVSEQNNKCCYCCKEIENNNLTELEHIIPRAKTSIAEFQPYYELSDILRKHVIPQNEFVMAAEKRNVPPFPHHIAYHNIVASCNGKSFDSSANDSFTCCNRQRRDEFIPPFNLMEDSICYLKDGSIVYLREPANRTFFGILNLDKTLLNQIRRLWYLFSLSSLSVDEILDVDVNSTKSLTEKIVTYAIANSNSLSYDNKLTETFSIINVWNIFKEFNYFLDYYRDNQQN